MTLDEAVRHELQAGRLEQACPCGRWEAAGVYCTACLGRIDPALWYRNGDFERRIAVVGPARAAEEAREKRPRKQQTPVHGLPDVPVGASAQLALGADFTSPLRASGVGLAPIPSPQPRSGSLSLTPDELRGRPRSARSG